MIKKGTYRVKNEQGHYDTVFFRTEADLVSFQDGDTLEQKMERVDAIESRPHIYYQVDEPANAINGSIWIVGE